MGAAYRQLRVVEFDELTTFCGHDDGSHCTPECAERNKRVAANRAALHMDVRRTDVTGGSRNADRT